jgi:hypothetical protein
VMSRLARARSVLLSRMTKPAEVANGL